MLPSNIAREFFSSRVDLARSEMVHLLCVSIRANTACYCPSEVNSRGESTGVLQAGLPLVTSIR